MAAADHHQVLHQVRMKALADLQEQVLLLLISRGQLRVPPAHPRDFIKRSGSGFERSNRSLTPATRRGLSSPAWGPEHVTLTECHRLRGRRIRWRGRVFLSGNLQNAILN